MPNRRHERPPRFVSPIAVSAAPAGLQPAGYSPQTMRRQHRDYRNVLSESAAPCLQETVAGFKVDERYLTPDGSRADSDEKKDIPRPEPLDECVIGMN